MSDGHWQLEGTAAELFERYLEPAITAKWAEDLLERAQPQEGEALLDIGCDIRCAVGERPLFARIADALPHLRPAAIA
jgi:hypothetical protein